MRRNMPVSNAKELSVTSDKMHTKYFNGLLEKAIKK
jgi:hypothetical protein